MDATPEPTIFSLSDALPAPDASAEGRNVAPDHAVLVKGAVGALCSVRKLSRRGAVLHLDSPVQVGQFLSFELMNGRGISGTVSWCNGTEVILRFGDDLDVLGVIANELVSQPGERRRMPRVELHCPLILHIGPRIIHASTVDLSQGGAKIAVNEQLATGTELVVMIDGFRPIDAEVRWNDDGAAGLSFKEELSWQEMMPRLRALTRGSAQAARPLNAVLSAGWESPSRDLQIYAPTVELNIPARIREGAERWSVTVVNISIRHVEFVSYTRPRPGALISITLPGIEGWPARVMGVDGDRWTCEFAHALHPAVLDRMVDTRSR